MTTLLLIRHGESEANRQGFFAGQTDVELLEKGLRQAAVTAAYIREHYQVDYVLASDLKRAYATGKCIAEVLGVELKTDSALREINAGRWSGMKFDDLDRVYAESYGIWRRDIGNACCPEGETVRQLSDRVMDALNRIARENPGKTLVVATHATPIRAAQTVIQLGDPARMREVPWVSNASVTEIRHDRGHWECLKVSEDRHLGDTKTVFPANV